MAKNKLVGTPNPPPSQQSPGPQFIGRDPCEYSPTIIRLFLGLSPFRPSPLLPEPLLLLLLEVTRPDQSVRTRFCGRSFLRDPSTVSADRIPTAVTVLPSRPLKD